MVSINYNFRPDDLGTESLKRDNTGPKGTQPVAASAAPKPVKDTENRVASQAPEAVEPYQGRDRRKGGDRRKRNAPVILDTRSKRERRRASDNDPDDAVRGIDVYT